MNRDFEKANRRDLTKRSYDLIASFRPAKRGSSKSRRRFFSERRRINERLQRAYWPQKFESAVAGEKTSKPDLTGNTNASCGEPGTNPEGMGNPSLRKNT